MHNIYSIGTISTVNGLTKVQVKDQYRKALKYLDKFSHIHLFYLIPYDESEMLLSVISQIVKVDIESGLLQITAAKEIPDSKLIDIKPYFPCEDSIKTDFILKASAPRYINAKRAKDNEFAISDAGTIHNRSGEIYIQMNEIPEITSPYIKVLWWFSKFETNMYRHATECNPPYENAPRSGIFATRSPVRPNPVAMTVVKVKRVDSFNKRIYADLDECFDNTPCLGVWNYGIDEDFVADAKVPEWLSHWLKWKEDKVEEQNVKISVSMGVTDLLQDVSKYCEEDSNTLKNHENNEKACDSIFVKGARENNLKGINVKIPYGRITAVVGVSGSGKSSLVNNTIYAECKRRMGYLNSERNLLQKPDMEYMTGAIPAVLISQKEITAGSKSTVGTYSDAYDYLRIIYSVAGIRHCPHCGNEIVPLKEEQIYSILESRPDVVVCDLKKVPVKGDTLSVQIQNGLKAGNGALLAKIESNYILFQTRQKCYRCDRIMFEITPASFSYTNPESRCTVCNGLGSVMELVEELLVEKPDLSLLEGASSFWGNLDNFLKSPNANWMKGQVIGLAELMKIDLKLPWSRLPQDYRKALIDGSNDVVTFSYDNKKTGRRGEITRPVEGVRQIIKRLYDGNKHADSILKYMREQKCSACNGERLNKEGRSVVIGNVRYPEAAAMNFIELDNFCTNLPKLLGHERYSLVKSCVVRLSELCDAARCLGLDHLALNRMTNTLSGGESQRLKLLTTMQNKMTGILYVLDEPSKGLHPYDYSKITDMLRKLIKSGNTVMMVEHNEDMIKIADNIVEIGPAAGEKGGYLIGEGNLNAMMSNKGSQTGKYMFTKTSRKGNKNFSDEQFIELKGLSSNNLKNIDIKFPRNALTCICGVSGSGKSTLLKQEIYHRMCTSEQFKEVVLMDQRPVGRTPRSVIATYMDIMDIIRKQFAETDDSVNLCLDDNYFSFNSEKGQCPVCKGEGRLKLPYMEDDSVICPECSGKRYKQSVLRVKYKSKSIADILSMSVDEAMLFWQDNTEISGVLSILKEVGLEYLKLGQSINSLSGGEASRIKLAKKLVRGRQKNTLFLFDEPTTGLHFSDIDKLNALISKIIEQGNTVVAIEHNRQFLNERDWTIMLGSGAGAKGGTLIKMDY